MLCKKCGKEFHGRIVIDGKSKPLYNRKYCLECSPYKEHNTTKLEVNKNLNKNNEVECVCCICNRTYTYSRNKGHTINTCNSCLQIKRRRKLKDKLVKYKGGKCEKCGYSKSNHALDFHHINPSEKDFNVSTHMNKSYNTLKTEADKCILVCSNCHREIHEEIGY